MSKRLLLLFALAVCLAQPSSAQFDRTGLGGGIGFGSVFGYTEVPDKVGQFQARAFLRYQFSDFLSGDLGLAISKVRGDGYETQIVPVDARLLIHPFYAESFRPFIYGGFGALAFKVIDPPYLAGEEKKAFWTTVIPVGAGMQFALRDNVALEVSGGVNFTGTDSLNAVVVDDQNDAFFTFLVGLTLFPGGGDKDPDRDGLTNDQEKQLGTDPNNAETDGDGLSDGEEVNTHKTSPVNADSDGDGLKDGEEVRQFKTDPNKADTDADGLRDGDEVKTHSTDPLKGDTDGDTLTDGDEVTKHRTNPLKSDTDAGTVDDGMEVSRGTDPLAAADDVKKEEPKVAVGMSIVLEGITFASGKADITPESEPSLAKAYDAMVQYPELAVEIQGHTDNTGSRAANMKLSAARAESVKQYLVGKGIDPARMTTAGFGPDKPIAPNTDAEGRSKNRRIEFLRTK